MFRMFTNLSDQHINIYAEIPDSLVIIVVALRKPHINFSLGLSHEHST